jgi:toxin ParE1/3/4
MNRYHVTENARADLDEIWLYIAQDSLEAADRLIDKMYATFLSLAQTPGMGRRREELAPGLRSFPVGSYLIFYRSGEDGIEAARVLHGARNIETLFKCEDEDV